jgi:hypothetical protein
MMGRSELVNIGVSHAYTLGLVTNYRHKVIADRHPARREEITRAVCEGFETEQG